MVTFEVQDMTCNHCVAAITRAIQALDADARVDIDLAAHRVQVGSAVSAEAMQQAIAEAGYTPSVLAVAQAAPAASGGCCGACH